MILRFGTVARIAAAVVACALPALAQEPDFRGDGFKDYDVTRDPTKEQLNEDQKATCDRLYALVLDVLACANTSPTEIAYVKKQLEDLDVANDPELEDDDPDEDTEEDDTRGGTEPDMTHPESPPGFEVEVYTECPGNDVSLDPDGWSPDGSSFSAANAPASGAVRDAMGAGFFFAELGHQDCEAHHEQEPEEQKKNKDESEAEVHSRYAWFVLEAAVWTPGINVKDTDFLLGEHERATKTAEEYGN